MESKVICSEGGRGEKLLSIHRHVMRVVMAMIVFYGVSGCMLLDNPEAKSLQDAGGLRDVAGEEVMLGMKTDLGDIKIALFVERAPITTANFLNYVDNKRFDGASFYRSVRLNNQQDLSNSIEVIQGGLTGAFLRQSPESIIKPFPPVAHETTKETGIKHEDGVLSVARGAPGTASSEFFISIGDNPALDYGGGRHPDGLGFAAFGQVVEGMEVVRAIHARSTERELPASFAVMRDQILAEQVVILSVFRSDD